MDDANHTATYLYLQLKNKEDITINKALLPNGYTLETDSVEFTVYE